jgi:3-oxoacyl-[acyl-carrier protein] reductase
VVSQGRGRVALVSRGSGGIGAATVARLAADGWDISFCYDGGDLSALEVEKAACELGARVLAVRADPADAAEAAAWVARAEDELGPAEALVTCAGMTRDRPLALMEEADWRAVIDTRLDGVFHLCRATLAAMMRRQSGRIVLVSSVSGVYAHGADGYPAVRGGVAGFARALASQTARYGIRVNALTPGTTHADLTAIVPEGTPLTETIVLRRFGSAAEVADRVAYLLSDQAAGTTGRVLEVHSGIALC